ncbi:MAG: lysoplasmalogenase [Chitinophagales bacterium]|nr:lysoplasmalogenase [Chitinophagales bacterium]
MVAKPLIMASLIGFYIGHESRQSNGFIMGMIFALMGDIFLLFTSKEFFILGLLCFLLMQIFYILEFKKDLVSDKKQLITRYGVIYLIGIVFLAILWNGLGSMFWYVAIYILAITTMVGTAFNRRKNIPWYREVTVGVVLFLISDAVLGLSEFNIIDLPFSSTIVMLTYDCTVFNRSWDGRKAYHRL